MGGYVFLTNHILQFFQPLSTALFIALPAESIS